MVRSFILSLAVFLSFFANVYATPQESKGEYVVIFHGIARSSSHMDDLAEYLGGRGYDVKNLDYPSTEYSLEDLTDIMYKDLANHITEDKKINFVGYSMGGIMVRTILQKYPQKNLGRVVQLAPPNNGSEIADTVQDLWIYKKIYGPAGQQLITNQENIKDLFGPITYELGIIAGSGTIDPISSSIIPGDDDGKVSIESTKLEGMKDHITISASHTFFPTNKHVQRQTVYFLRNGEFFRP